VENNHFVLDPGLLPGSKYLFQICIDHAYESRQDLEILTGSTLARVPGFRIYISDGLRPTLFQSGCVALAQATESTT